MPALRHAVLTTACLLTAASLQAQAPSSLVGSRVRVTTLTAAPGTRTTGMLTMVAGDSLRIERDAAAGPITFASSDVTSLEQYAGSRGHAGTGALVGMTLGAVAGVAGMVAFCQNFALLSQPDCSRSDAIESGALGGITGAAVGSLLGALVGVAVRTDKWEPVNVSPTLTGSAPGIAISWKF